MAAFLVTGNPGSGKSALALRHGFNALTRSKWQAIFSLEQEFSAALGASIYTVLPGVVENTFGLGDGRAVALMEHL